MQLPVAGREAAHRDRPLRLNTGQWNSRTHEGVGANRSRMLAANSVSAPRRSLHGYRSPHVEHRSHSHSRRGSRSGACSMRIRCASIRSTDRIPSGRPWRAGAPPATRRSSERRTRPLGLGAHGIRGRFPLPPRLPVGHSTTEVADQGAR
jgi:hypothetical protein